ncbi:MAG TPA: HAD family phosphatase [Flavobacteriaceae bacterium]|nr:HAD family phosphatase [Flavobacteriaceae bacterium]
MQKITTIIFDLGGVLVDWNPAYFYKTIFDSEEKMNWFLTHVCSPEWNIEQDGGRSIAEAEKVFLEQYPEYKTETLAFYKNWHLMFSGPITKNVKIFKALKASNKYNLFALTNWSAEKWEEGVKLFPFFNEFDDVVVSGQVKMRKPFPEVFNFVLHKFRINPEETLFIDDNLENINTAKKLGFKTIYIKTNTNLKEKLFALNITI